jgi:DNA-binding MarR family transcriptional regulator
MTTYKSISQYAENSRYFYDPSSVEELQGVLRSVYVHVKESPKDASGSLFEIFDKNIRQLLKNLLVYRSFNQELEDFQSTLVLFESIINKSSDKALARRYLERCRFASEVVGDRINELSADKSKLVSQPQVRVVLDLIAKGRKVRQKFIQDRLEVSKQRTSNILRQMRSASLIDAVFDEEDKRERLYVLTDPGKVACEECGISIEEPRYYDGAIRAGITPYVVKTTRDAVHAAVKAAWLGHDSRWVAIRHVEPLLLPYQYWTLSLPSYLNESKKDSDIVHLKISNEG